MSLMKLQLPGSSYPPFGTHLHLGCMYEFLDVSVCRERCLLISESPDVRDRAQRRSFLASPPCLHLRRGLAAASLPGRRACSEQEAGLVSRGSRLVFLLPLGVPGVAVWAPHSVDCPSFCLTLFFPL